MRILGIDASLTATGLCVINPSGPFESLLLATLSPPAALKSQPLKIMWQRDAIEKKLRVYEITHLAIEQPFVLPMASRGKGGHQSSNLWALYIMLLDLARNYQLPICAFHLSQLKSLIGLKSKNSADKKLETIRLAMQELPGLKVNNDNEADAYFIAKFGERFWNAMESVAISYTFKELDILISGEKSMKNRPGDAWFDFRNPLDKATLLHG